jgi:tetratricopeptide (TPR) repeat protein
MAKSIRMLMAGLLLFVLFSGCNLNKKKGEEVVVPTNEELKRAEVNKRLDRRWDDASAHYDLGKIYLSDGMLSQAENEFSIAMGYDPVHWDSAAAMVRTLVESDQQSKAKILAEDYIRRGRYSASASLLLGKAFQKEYFDEYALTCFEQALRIAPDSAGLNKEVGFYHLSKKDEVRAVSYLRHSFEIDPRQADVARALGKLGVTVELPSRRESNTKFLDKLLRKKDKEKL